MDSIENYKMLTIENAYLQSFISADSNPMGSSNAPHIYNFAINGQDTDQSGWEDVVFESIEHAFDNGIDIVMIVRNELAEGVKTSGN